MIENYENFSEGQIKILQHFVTNVTSNIFVLRHLPEVIKGALFSRYSRSSLGLRSLLLKEFILSEETAFNSIVDKKIETKEERDENEFVAIKKAQNFYDRILDGYGDDSIGELGGAHLAIENISMIAAKEIEDSRIGGSPLEKSTRYVYFDQKIGGEYLFYREPVLMTSAYRDIYIDTCNYLFNTYAALIPPLTERIGKSFPKDQQVSNTAYGAALRAKVLDCLRGLLPAGTLTNMGVFGNGRFFESLIQKLNGHSLTELQDIGKKSFEELSKVIPSFIRRADLSNKYQKSFTEFREKQQNALKRAAKQFAASISKTIDTDVRLIRFESEAPLDVIAALLFQYADGTIDDLKKMAKEELNQEERLNILEAAAAFRENRRHKSPRALEHAYYTFEIKADFGVYRDLQRHRMLTQERQLLTCEHGYFIPAEILDTEMEMKYRDALQKAKKAFETIQQELPEEAQYVVPMAFNVRWYFHVNLRALQWLCELRASPAGHPSYRHIAQSMAKQVIHVHPEFERFFKFVDFGGYELGRLGQEIRNEEKQEARR